MFKKVFSYYLFLSVFALMLFLTVSNNSCNNFTRKQKHNDIINYQISVDSPFYGIAPTQSNIFPNFDDTLSYEEIAKVVNFEVVREDNNDVTTYLSLYFAPLYDYDTNSIFWGFYLSTVYIGYGFPVITSYAPYIVTFDTTYNFTGNLLLDDVSMFSYYENGSYSYEISFTILVGGLLFDFDYPYYLSNDEDFGQFHDGVQSIRGIDGSPYFVSIDSATFMTYNSNSYSDFSFLQSVYGFNDGYNEGLIDGRNFGFDEGYTQGRNYGEEIGFERGYDVGYDDGLGLGYSQGLASAEETINSLRNDIDYLEHALESPGLNMQLKELFWSIGGIPFETIKQIWNFEFLGINLSQFAIGLITSLLIIWFIKKFLLH